MQPNRKYKEKIQCLVCACCCRCFSRNEKNTQIWKIRKRVILWVNFDAQRQTVGHPPGFPKNAKFDRERRSLRAFLRRGYKKTKIKNTMSCLCLLLSMFFKKWKKPHLLKTKNKMSCLCLLLSMFFDKEKNLHP